MSERQILKQTGWFRWERGHIRLFIVGGSLVAAALVIRLYLFSRADDVYLLGNKLMISSAPQNLIPDSTPLLSAALEHPLVPEADYKAIKRFCGSCHALPPPSSLPKRVWREKVLRGYEFLEMPDLASKYKIRAPYPKSSVINYYEHRAPEKLPALAQAELTTPPIKFAQEAIKAPPSTSHPSQPPFAAVVNVNMAPLTRSDRPDVLVCDVKSDSVMLLRPYEKSPKLQALTKGFPPAHTEVADLDRDGIKDVLVANIGDFLPTDKKVGSAVWLRGRGSGDFTPVTLLSNVGRVSDVRVADFDGDGDNDLIVAVFGFLHIGEILYLENRTTDWSHPHFVRHVLDSRPGAIHVPVTDLNHDGRPDFIALITQDKEIVVAFLNQGKGRFRQQVIFRAPHPAYGSSGIQLLDFDKDGDADVLMTNGDCLDPPLTLRPDNGIQWLENRGTFPFVRHAIAAMYGAYRAVAADIDGDKDLDIVAVSILPGNLFPQRDRLNLDAILLLEQKKPGHYVRYALEKKSCDHVTCAVGDLDGDGRVDMVTGNLDYVSKGSLQNICTIWKNLGPSGLRKKAK